MAIGNHEFDDGPEELDNFIRQVKRSDPGLNILSANTEVAGDSVLAGLIGRSVVKVMACGVKVAIIGYTTPDTMFLAKPGNKVVIGDEVQAIQSEINRLKVLHPSLNIFIAVGHSGYERDLQIAAAIADLDVVVGGHTDTFLFTGGTPPSTEVPEGEYPTVVRHQQSGDQTLVVQAFAYGKYLGKLDLVFDSRGRVVQHGGQPILVSHSMEEDGDTKRLLVELNDQLNSNLLGRIGYTEVDLVQKRCRAEQCNIGNLIADALADYSAERLHFIKQKSFSGSKGGKGCSEQPPLAIINSGTIRGGIRSGVISYKSVLSALPIGNQQGLMSINGSDLLALFEASASQHRQGGFLQVSSGFEVHYRRSGNNSKLELERVRIRCNVAADGSGGDGSWTAVDRQSTYHVVVSEFTVRGGDGYSVLKGVNWTHYHISDSDVLAKYIRRVDNATTVLDGRLIIH